MSECQEVQLHATLMQNDWRVGGKQTQEEGENGPE